MKKLLTLLFVFGISTSIYSQQINTGSSYTTAVGIKVYPGALTIKHFINDNIAIEGLGYFWQYGFRVTGLYEIHGNINGAPGLKWYVGPGAHVGVYNTTWTNDYHDRKSGPTVGIDGVLGLDYKIQGAPLNVSFDWQPSFDLIGYNYFEGGWGGIAVRYTF